MGRSELELSKVVVRRGLFLFGAGLAFAVIVWLPEEVFDRDILTLLGTSTLILFRLRKWSPRRLVGLAILVLLISPPLRTALGYASHWRGEEYIYRFTMKDVVLGFLLQGYFPLLPWVVFALVGFATGKHYWGDESGDRFSGWGLPVVGLGLVGLAGLGFWVSYCGLNGRRVSPEGAAMTFLRRYSRFSLTTYMVHHAVHVWTLLLLAAWKGKREPWWYYGEAVSTPLALTLALLFIAGFYGVLLVWERRRRYGFDGALRWLIEA